MQYLKITPELGLNYLENELSKEVTINDVIFIKINQTYTNLVTLQDVKKRAGPGGMNIIGVNGNNYGNVYSVELFMLPPPPSAPAPPNFAGKIYRSKKRTKKRKSKKRKSKKVN